MASEVRYDYLFKLVMIGDSNVGKTSLLERFADGNFRSDVVNTIGVDFRVKTINIKNKVIKVQIWDTAGSEVFQSVAASYYRHVHGVIVVFDLTSSISFDNIRVWYNRLSDYAPADCVKVLVGNKSDLVRDLNENKCTRAVNLECVKEVARDYGMSYIETSAKNSTNVGKAFESLCETIFDKLANSQMTTKVITGCVLRRPTDLTSGGSGGGESVKSCC